MLDILFVNYRGFKTLIQKKFIEKCTPKIDYLNWLCVPSSQISKTFAVQKATTPHQIDDKMNAFLELGKTNNINNNNETKKNNNTN